VNALPCYAGRAARQYAEIQGLASGREDQINERASQLADEMWQDLEHLTDALDDAVSTVGYYRTLRTNHPQAARVLALFRDGTDDAELARILRKAARTYIDNLAHDRVEEEAAEAVERANQDRAEARWAARQEGAA